MILLMSDGFGKGSTGDQEDIAQGTVPCVDRGRGLMPPCRHRDTPGRSNIPMMKRAIS